MQKKSISVIIPVYNREEKIIRAIDSVVKQTEVDYVREIIVVDDGSTDSTVITIEQYAKEHVVPPIRIISQENRGVSAARNRAMHEATGMYFAFLDSDDMWLPDKLAKQMIVFDRYKDAFFVGGNHHSASLRIGFRKIRIIHKATLKELCIKSFPVTPSVVIKRQVFDEIGGFDETLHCYEDCDYFQTICAKGYGYYYIPDQVVLLDDKRQFGDKGLSSNLNRAHKDSLISLKKMYINKYISLSFYVFLRIFYYTKHLRRLLISSFHKSS